MANGLLARAFAVAAAGPTAGTPLALFQFLAGSADASFARLLLPCVLDPADELVAGERCDVIPGSERRRIGDARAAQVCGQLVYNAAWYALVAHAAKFSSQRGLPH